ncbi:Uncharacterized protein Fot_02027 [Forsythia ovata]|uniref:Uncharacterized protein n=1 Tax=Forsythia ovata TaxID=205694 RepID=A0ABD1X8P6_9LAMI
MLISLFLQNPNQESNFKVKAGSNILIIYFGKASVGSRSQFDSLSSQQKIVGIVNRGMPILHEGFLYLLTPTLEFLRIKALRKTETTRMHWSFGIEYMEQGKQKQQECIGVLGLNIWSNENRNNKNALVQMSKLFQSSISMLRHQITNSVRQLHPCQGKRNIIHDM